MLLANCSKISSVFFANFIFPFYFPNFTKRAVLLVKKIEKNIIVCGCLFFDTRVHPPYGFHCFNYFQMSFKSWLAQLIFRVENEDDNDDHEKNQMR